MSFLSFETDGPVVAVDLPSENGFLVSTNIGLRGIQGIQGDEGPAGSPSAFEKRGTGFPEGAVTAPVGTYYTDTAATSGAIRWVKASGTGNTGWRVVFGDTGWRNVANLLTAGLAVSTAAGVCRIRRINDTIYFEFKLDVTVAGVSNVLGSAGVILGFRTDYVNKIVSASYQAPGTGHVFPSTVTTSYMNSNAWRIASGPAPPATYSWFGEFLTTDLALWPATLPGVPG